MKYVIVGGGLTGLYLGYLLQNINIDFEIYEKSSVPGGKIKAYCNSNIILPYHINLLEILDKFSIKYNIKNYNIECNLKLDNLLKYILDKYNKLKPKDISVYIFIQSILTNYDFQKFLSLIIDRNILENEISTFMKYNFYDINQANKYNRIFELKDPNELINKLSDCVKDNLYVNNTVQEIVYFESTNKYLLVINNNYINADKLIIATDISIKNIKLSIPDIIYDQFEYIKSFPYLKLITKHNNKITLKNNILLSKSIFSNIRKLDDYTLSMDYIIGNNADILLELLKTDNNELLTNILKNVIKDIPDIIKFNYCFWKNGYHINTKILKTNFYKDYNIILAGEWVSLYHNTLEGSCISALKTYKIIESELYMDIYRKK